MHGLWNFSRTVKVSGVLRMITTKALNTISKAYTETQCVAWLTPSSYENQLMPVATFKYYVRKIPGDSTSTVHVFKSLCKVSLAETKDQVQKTHPASRLCP